MRRPRWSRGSGRPTTAPQETSFHFLCPRPRSFGPLRTRVGAGNSARLRVSADLELPAPKLSELTRTGARDVSLGVAGRVWPGYRYDVRRMLRARDSGAFDAVVAGRSTTPRLETLVGAGVDGVLTDEPALLRGIVEAAGRAARRA